LGAPVHSTEVGPPRAAQIAANGKAVLMTTDEARRPKNCSVCGKGHYQHTARAGRTEEYKGFSVELPADYPLLECDACGELLMSPADMKYLAPFIETAFAVAEGREKP